MKEFKSGYVAIIGRTNVGKSTLLNNLAGTKIAAMANKPQTTRNAIKAIVTTEDYQIVFVDTPGIHKPKHKLGEMMNTTAFEQLQDVDIVVFIIEAQSDEIGRGDKLIIEKLKEQKIPTLLLINKIDLVEKEKLLNLINIYKNEYNFEVIIPISATKNEGIDLLLKEIEKLLPIGPAYYNEEELTDQTERQIIEDLVREKCLKLLDQEVPHGIIVEVEKMKLRTNKEGIEIYDIDATIYCERNSHKGIIIGKNGAMLKRISSYARQDAEKLLDTKVNLKVWVKVKEGWQDNENFWSKFYTKK